MWNRMQKVLHGGRTEEDSSGSSVQCCDVFVNNGPSRPFPKGGQRTFLWRLGCALSEGICCWASIKAAEGLSLSRRLVCGAGSLWNQDRECHSWHRGITFSGASAVGRSSFRALSPCGSKFCMWSQQMQDGFAAGTACLVNCVPSGLENLLVWGKRS